MTSHSEGSNPANQPVSPILFSSAPPLLSSVPPQTPREGAWSGPQGVWSRPRLAAPGGSRQSPEPSAALAPFAVHTTYTWEKGGGS